jgi:hypothetical protein
MTKNKYSGLGFTYLLNIDQNAKTIKGNSKGFLTAVLYLAPHKISGTDVCPYSTQGCRAGCLYTAGKGGMAVVKKARISRTKYFLEYRTNFMIDLEEEIRLASIKAEKRGLELVVRLNGTSDIDWNFYYEQGFIGGGTDGDLGYIVRSTIFEQFPAIQFYDYTKDQRKFINNKVPNYHLTFSKDETTSRGFSFAVLNEYKGNIAVVFDNPSYKWLLANSISVIDGEAHDLRFLDEPGKIVALKAKGQARKDKHGFVMKGVTL